MRTMKLTALVLSFAAVLAAQQAPEQAPSAKDPRVELAAAIAVEEQERDLAKAEALYREALAGSKLSAEARVLAQLRLGGLLQRLGRAQEAEAILAAVPQAAGFDDFGPAPQQQDVERQAALRAKADELVRKFVALDQNQVQTSRELQFVPPDIAQQLLWIGEPAVPVVIAAIEKLLQGPSYHPQTIGGLAGFLWRAGGPSAAKFLTAGAKNPEPAFRGNLVWTAFQADRPEMVAAAAEYLRDADDDVFWRLINCSSQYHRALKFESAVVVDACLAGSPTRKAWLLQWATRDDVGLEPTSLGKLVQLARDALQSTEPALGAAAEQFLLSAAAQESIEGLELLLQQLPQLAATGKTPQPPRTQPTLQTGVSPGPRRPRGTAGRQPSPPSRFTKEEALRLLPLASATAQKLGVNAGTLLDGWLRGLLWSVAEPLDEVVLPHTLAWIDLGRVSPEILDGRVTTANAADVFARFDKVDNKRQLLQVLAQASLPVDLYPAMVAKADAAIAADNKPEGQPAMAALFGAALVKTGNPEAAEWLLKVHAEGTSWGPKALVELGSITQDERVRAAMRAFATVKDHRNVMLLALLAMHDAQALALVAQWPGTAFDRLCWHPYAKSDEQGQITPLRYLVQKDVDPPHGFTEDDVIGVLRTIAAREIPNDWEPKFWSAGLIPDRVLGEIARLVARAPDRLGKQMSDDWIWLVLERRRQAADGGLRDWPASMLRDEAPRIRFHVFYRFNEQEVQAHRELIEACLDVDDETCAARAVKALQSGGVPVDAERMATSRHPDVRRLVIDVPGAEARVRTLLTDPDDLVRIAAAEHCGATVDKEAVPALIALLRDGNEHAREAAGNALTRIRFYHEQQAHWDRVLKGLDASPASAAEKLLLQAKPGAPRAQRLLAIKSLGTLGVPEALPFLIEWSNEADAEIAAAAQAAITAIHLEPRK